MAELFVAWVSPRTGLRWLDVGCGTGALSQAIVSQCEPGTVTAIDQSEGFVRTAQQRTGGRVTCKVGNALSLPVEDSSTDIAVSGLLLNFIPEPEKALAEMRRVTTSGGVVAAYVWDYAGKMEFLEHFWNAVVKLDPDASGFHEGQRFAEANAEGLRALFEGAGFSGIASTPLDIVTNFSDFDDYWMPFLGGQGPAPTYVSKLEEPERSELRNALARRLPINEDGTISLRARAWAVKGFT